MDCDCYHLVYRKIDVSKKASDSPSCQHCSDRLVQTTKIVCAERAETPKLSLEQALTGRMVPYVQNFHLEECDVSQEACKLFVDSETPLSFVQRRAVISQEGAIHMRDVSPHGTWLSVKEECLESLRRLRFAGLICVRIPELNRQVLEQKNDDWLLYLANEWLLDNENVNESIELFGPFACDAMLAPVLHRILRSEWIEERKGLSGTNIELKLGWAQEFYDWKSLPRTTAGVPLFSNDAHCPNSSDIPIRHTDEPIKKILDKLRWCGFTPWSAVQAVRCSETCIGEISCQVCRYRLLNACIFLMECAAVEASREHDWLVRNEAVIELCSLLYQISVRSPEDTKLLEAWAEAIVSHSVRFHELSFSSADVDALVVMFAVDHLPFLSDRDDDAELRAGYNDHGPKPDSELLKAIELNKKFSCKLTREAHTSNCNTTHICGNFEVPTEVPDSMEAGPQRVDTIAQALVLCFPRVAVWALHDLTLKVPKALNFSKRIWPVFVNPTRACYQLFRALALPLSPSPTYVLELLARSWRSFPVEAFQSLMPMSSCGMVKVSNDHYAKHLIGPLDTLVQIGATRSSERDSMLRSLDSGVLPCFAGEGDSAADRLVSSTLALTFAASGLLVFGPRETEENRCSLYRTATRAGLSYFAAWYILVYAAAVHVHPTLKAQLSQKGTDADRHLCSALKLTGVEAGTDDFEVADFEESRIEQALNIVFEDLLDVSTVRHCAELYIPELLMQLPFAKKLNFVPGNVKSVIEMRDVWFAKEHGGHSSPEQTDPPFVYLGEIAHGLYSSIRGTLNVDRARRTALALRGIDREYDPWCDTLLTTGFDNDLGIEGRLLLLSLDSESEEIFY